MRKRIRNLSAFGGVLLTTALLAIVLIICYWQANGLIHPPSGIPTMSSFVAQTDWRDVVLQTEDELRLNGWLFMPKVPLRGTILYVHGHGGGRSQILEKTMFLLELGYAVFTFDLRNHGTSDGTITTMGLLEVRDVKAAYGFLMSQPEIAVQPIVLYGLSMGGATAIRVMPELPQVKALIIETAYTTFIDVTNDAVKIRAHLPAFPFGDMILKMANLISGENLYEIRPIDVIGQIAPRPILFIHGTDDAIIPIQHSEALYNQAGEPKLFYAVPGGTHANLYAIDPVTYQQKFTDFLAQYVHP